MPTSKMLKMVKCQKNRQAIPFFSKTLPSPVDRFHLLLQQIRVFFRFSWVTAASNLQVLHSFCPCPCLSKLILKIYQSIVFISCLSRLIPFGLLQNRADQRPAPGAARPRGRAGLPHIKASPGLAPQGFQLLVRLRR